MKIKFYTLFTFVLVIGLTTISCEGPEGPTGPEGPQGETGPQGPQGEEGTANVIYSEWIPTDWNFLDEAHLKIMYLEESRVTGDFIKYRDPSGVFSIAGYGNCTNASLCKLYDKHSATHR